jgi:hypothetical protein
VSEKKIIVKVAGKEIVLPKKKADATRGRPEVVVFDQDPFKPAKNLPRRVKALLFGPTGTRKTRTALQFPKPAVADGEEGTHWYADEFDFARLPFDNFVTFSGFYQFQPTDWQHIKAEWKDMMKRILGLDMHIIFTAREKTLYAEGEMMRAIGKTQDGEKNMFYHFDVVLQLIKNEKEQTVATCLKDRTGKLPNVPFHLTYDVFTTAFGAKYLERPMDEPPPPAPEPPTEVEIEVGEVNEPEPPDEPEPPEPSDEETVADLHAEVPKTDVTLPKEEGIICPKCEKRVPTLKLHKESKISVCKACHKELDKPAGSSKKPIKVTLTKGKKKGAKSKGNAKAAKPVETEFCTAQQEKDIRGFCEALGISEKKMMKSLGAYDATSFKTLTAAKAVKIIANLEKMTHEKTS